MRGEETQKVIIQLKSETPLNEMSGNSLDKAAKSEMFAKEVRSNKEKTGLIVNDMVQIGGRVKESFNNLGLISAELPLSKIQELSNNENIAYISPDREIEANDAHVIETTGWNNPGIIDLGDNNSSTWLGGGRGTIAVIDSGIDIGHNLMKWMDLGGRSKVFQPSNRAQVN